MADVDSLDFELLPRFYIIGYFNENSAGFDEVKQFFRSRVLEQSPLLVDAVNVTKLAPFEFNNYTALGFFEVSLKKLDLAKRVQPPRLFIISQLLEEVIQEVNAKYRQDVYLDPHNPPYVVNTAVRSSAPEELFWTKATILSHKRSIAKWVEFYSGQFHDYSEDLYLSRIQNNLSNRLSELHFIRVNSSFIYMPTKGYEKYFRYMEEYFIHQVLRVKSLVFAYYTLNEQMDSARSMLSEIGRVSIDWVKKTVEETQLLDQAVARISDQAFKDQIINRRAHSKKVLQNCLELYEVDAVQKGTEEKMKRLLAIRNAAQEQHMTNLTVRCAKWLACIAGLAAFFAAYTLYAMLDDLGIALPSYVIYVTYGLAVFFAVLSLIAVIAGSFSERSSIVVHRLVPIPFVSPMDDGIALEDKVQKQA